MFRASYLGFAAVLLLVSLHRVSAQNANGQHASVTRPTAVSRWNPSPQELSAPYWTLEPGWITELEVRNNLATRDLDVTPVLRPANGSEVALAPVHLRPNEIVSINVQDAVAKVSPGLVGGAGAYGSVVFRFNGRTASNAFAASLIRRQGSPIDFHFDALDGGYAALEGVWWLPTENATDYLILANPSTKPVAASVSLSDTYGVAHQFSVSLTAGQSRRIDIREVFRTAAINATGGISISTEGGGELYANEIAFDETTGFSAMMKFFDRRPEPSATNHVLRIIAVSIPYWPVPPGLQHVAAP